MKDKIMSITEKFNIDALLISNAKDIRYFTGFVCEDCILLYLNGAVTIITDSRYTTAAKTACPDIELNITQMGEGYIQRAVRLVNESGIHCLGFQDKALTAEKYIFICDKLECETRPIGDAVLRFRAVKSKAEIERIEKSQRITENAFTELLKYIQPGVTEKQLAVKLQFILLDMGAERLAFDIIIASGKNGALPHAKPTDKPLNKGELITLDFGAVFDGYCSDMTRTVALGKPDIKLKEIYEIVLNAQMAAIEKLKSGIPCSQADNVAREYIKGCSYGEYFVHSLGHGVGLDIHEMPTLSYKSDDMLEQGMVVTVEPGIYIPEYCGVRIEDLCQITENGYENLTRSDKKLLIL